MIYSTVRRGESKGIQKTAESSAVFLQLLFVVFVIFGLGSNQHFDL
jgi:hypothetical protein